MREMHCAAAINHPPYSCTRQARRSPLEAISLSFGFAQLAYSTLIAVTAWLFWRRFRHRRARAASMLPQHRNLGALGELARPEDVADGLAEAVAQNNMELALQILASQQHILRKAAAEINARIDNVEKLEEFSGI